MGPGGLSQWRDPRHVLGGIPGSGGVSRIRRRRGRLRRGIRLLRRDQPGGRVLYGYNWGAAAAGWYRITLSIDGIANGVAANASITGVNPDDQLADESEGGSGGSSKGFFPPTFVEDSDGNYVYLDVYVAPKPAALPGT